MKTTTKLTMAAALAAMVAGSAVYAAGGQGRGGPRGMQIEFSQLDADGDGLVTQAELEAHRSARFTEIDADGNGEVSLEEFQSHAQARSSERAAEMFARLDADGDGVLSRDVLEAQGGRRGGGALLERIDSDGDGAISEAEFEAMKERLAERRGGFGKRHGGGRANR